MLQPAKLSRVFKLAITLLISFGFSTSLMANPIIPVPTQPQPFVAPSAPNLNAQGYVLMDANSGKILAEKNPHKRLAPASLTKLMTMYIISDAIKSGTIRLDDKVRISTKAWKTGGSRMFVKVNHEVPVQDLLHGIVVASGNDASVAMAEYLAGTEEAFAAVMNSTAKTLGMNDSNFVDSNGLPNPEHYSSAYDLALLAQAIIKKFPEDYKLYSEKWFSYNKIKQPNRNRLLWRYQYADGLKTGHTDSAGYCLVASAIKDGTRLISVIMGEPSDAARTEDSIRLLTYGFRFFETHKLYNSNTSLASVRVWKGKNKNLPIGLKDDLYVTFPSGQYKNLKSNIELNNALKAPIAKGASVGNLIIKLNDQVLSSQPLIALEDDPKGGIWRRVSDSVSFSINKIFSRSQEKINNG